VLAQTLLYLGRQLQGNVWRNVHPRQGEFHTQPVLQKLKQRVLVFAAKLMRYRRSIRAWF